MKTRSIFFATMLASLTAVSCSEEASPPPAPPTVSRPPSVPARAASERSRVRLDDGCEVVVADSGLRLRCEETEEACVPKGTADFVPATGSETVFSCHIPGVDDQLERNVVAIVAGRSIVWATHTEFVDSEDSDAIRVQDLTGDGHAELVLTTVEIGDLVHTKLAVFRFDSGGHAERVLMLETGLGGDRDGFSSAVSLDGSNVQVVRTAASAPRRPTTCTYNWSPNLERFVPDGTSAQPGCSQPEDAV